MTAVNKISNEYAEMLGGYPPKAVIAGVVVSLLMRFGETTDRDEINRLFVEEWKVLNDNGIIPQKPKFRRKEKS
jgi:hypothetical protein